MVCAALRGLQAPDSDLRLASLLDVDLSFSHLERSNAMGADFSNAKMMVRTMWARICIARHRDLTESFKVRAPCASVRFVRARVSFITTHRGKKAGKQAGDLAGDRLAFLQAKRLCNAYAHLQLLSNSLFWCRPVARYIAVWE